MMRDHTLPSGATLKLASATFEQSKTLLQAVLKEMKAISIAPSFDTEGGYKDLFKTFFCGSFSSPEIERALKPCLERCLYVPIGEEVGPKIDKDTFEPVERRQDYVSVVIAVAMENLEPFMKSLYAEYEAAKAALLKPSQA